MTEHYYAGIDLGGTKILVVVTDADGDVRGEIRVATQAHEGPDAVIERITQATRDAAAKAGVEVGALSAAGVSAPGPIDVPAGVITDPPNLPGWHDVPLARILRERLDVSVQLENDANCSAVGEHAFGAGRGYDDMVFVTISTGIGAGIIIDKKLYHGTSGAAGEIGHLPVALEGRACAAGHPGCLEAYASGTGIAARARELVERGTLPVTAGLAEKEPPLSAKTVYEASQQGERAAAKLIEEAGRYFGMGLASIINIFNPAAIVLGGGLTRMGDAILQPACEVAKERSFEQPYNDVRIVTGELGDRSAALGAVALVRSRDAKGGA